jgi:hypothetical protein
MSKSENSKPNPAPRGGRALTEATPFSEKGFYLSELRDRTIAIALASGAGNGLDSLSSVLDELA